MYIYTIYSVDIRLLEFDQFECMVKTKFYLKYFEA